MGAPQIVMICLFVFSVTAALCRHGQPRDPSNAWFTIIDVGVLVAVLQWGGFF